MSRLLSLLLKGGIAYAGYKFYESVRSVKAPVKGGISSEAKHDAVDNAEEASMDSFPSSDPPASNVFN